jgi:iduronate 2-sulfatase
MIIRAPGKDGGKTMALTELIDIYPTLCDLAGIETLDYMQGNSVAPLMDNPNKEWKEAVFSQFHRRPKVSPDGKRYMGYSVQTKDMHLIEWRTWDLETTQPGEVVAIELYDHKADPDENVNIAGTEEYKTEEAKLIQLLRDGWKGVRPN